MKRTAFVGALFICAAALSAQSIETIPFRAVLSAKNETTAVVDSNAQGAVTVWLHVVRDSSGKVASGSLDFSASYKFSGAATLTAMHIHKAAAGVAGAIVIPVPLTRFDDAGGAGAIPVKQVQFASTDATMMDAVNGMLADPSGYYFNIHTADAPAGAMRGQLQRAEMVVLMGQMSPANETPPIQGLSASGIATVVGLRTLDSDFKLTSGAVIFDVNYSGFPSDTTFTGFHVHFGGAGAAGPVVLDSGIRAGNTVATASGSGNLHYEFDADLTRSLGPETVNALFQNPAGAYINLHTTVNPGGAIRAQLHRTDHAVIGTVMTTQQEAATPAVSIDASTPVAIHIYTLRNQDGTVPAGAVVFDANPRFPSGTTFTAMHIHDEVAGKNGPVTIDSKLAATPLLTTDSGGNIWRLATVSTDSAVSSLNDLVVNPEKHYVNLHTSQFPGGATRAQLGPATAPAPQISTAISAVSDITRTTAANKSLMSIYGSGLAKLFANLDGFVQIDTVPKKLNGTSVTIGGADAPVLLVSPNQVMVEVPAEVAAGDQPVIVTNPAGASNSYQMKVQAAAPNIFFDGLGGLVSKTDFSLVRPGSPAAAGDVLLIFSTGNGQTTPALSTGRVPPANQLFNAQAPTVTIGGKDAAVIYSIACPGFPGLYQTAVRMPAGVPAGTAAVQMTVGGVASNSVNIAVR
jgi:uncharacterized protein (TIGR03437 family)